MQLYKEHADEADVWDANHVAHGQGSTNMFQEEDISASQPTAAGPIMSKSYGAREILSQPMDDLDLNSQAPDLDYGMSYSQLLQSGTPIEIGNAEAAVLRGSIAPLCGSSKGRVGYRGRQPSICPPGRAGRSGAPSRRISFGSPAGTPAAGAYRPPRPSRGSGRDGGGSNGAHGGPVDGVTADNDFIDNDDAGSEHAPIGDDSLLYK